LQQDLSIYVQRADYVRDFIPLFQSLNIPILEEYDKNHLNVIIKTIDNNSYKKITQNSNKITQFIKETLNL